MKEKRQSKALVIAAYGYLFLPFLIFIGGWLKWYFAVPMLLFLLFVFYRMARGRRSCGFPRRAGGRWESSSSSYALSGYGSSFPASANSRSRTRITTPATSCLICW